MELERIIDVNDIERLGLKQIGRPMPWPDTVGGGFYKDPDGCISSVIEMLKERGEKEYLGVTHFMESNTEVKKGPIAYAFVFYGPRNLLPDVSGG